MRCLYPSNALNAQTFEILWIYSQLGGTGESILVFASRIATIRAGWLRKHVAGPSIRPRFRNKLLRRVLATKKLHAPVLLIQLRPFHGCLLVRGSLCISTRSEAQLNTFQPPEGTRHYERCATLSIGMLHIGTCHETQSCALRAAKGASENQSRSSLHVLLLQSCTMRETYPSAFRSSLIAAHQKGRPTRVCGQVHCSAIVEEERRAFRIVMQTAQVQRSGAIKRLRIDVRASEYQQA